MSENAGIARITHLSVEGFRSIAAAEIALGPLTVFLGPNGSGKTNLVSALEFLSLTAREDLPRAVEEFGGFDRLLRRAEDAADQRGFTIEVDATVTRHSSETAPDHYRLSVGEGAEGLIREEIFTFKRRGGPGRRITVRGSDIESALETGDVDDPDFGERRSIGVASSALTGLYNLQRIKLGSDDDDAMPTLAGFLANLYVFDPQPHVARRPSRIRHDAGVPPLRRDGSNLAAVLLALDEHHPEAMTSINWDLRQCLPGLRGVEVRRRGGDAEYAVAGLRESGVRGLVDLADASYGTVRMLALLTLLHHPEPPPVIAIEEIDGGLHPHALDVLVDVLRATSERAQLLVATHSPTFVNQLEPEEVVICDRDAETGESIIPAIGTDELEEALGRHKGLGLGELWYSGLIEGVPVDGPQ